MDDTQEFLADGSTQRLPKAHSLAVVDVAGLSHPGKVRPNNEDHFLIFQFGRYLEALATNLPPEHVPSRFEGAGYGMVVADGMGGHAAGEEASQLAITTLLDLVRATPDWILSAENRSSLKKIMRRANERFGRINRTLAAEAQNDPRLQGFGTTMTLAASVGTNLIIAHIGDSRTYLFRHGELYQLTRDHTIAGDMCEAGIMTSAQAAKHRLRHVLTKNLGAPTGERPDVENLTLESGDCVLLCTDGLNEMVSDDQIAGDLAAETTSKAKCEKLIDRALAAGGKDNVTVIVSRYQFAAS